MRAILAIALVALIGISGYCVLKTQGVYASEASSHEAYMQFKPEMLGNALGAGTNALEPKGEEVKQVVVNQNIVDLQVQNEDVVGWITVPHTGIDYPFVQAADNGTYLHKNLYGEKAAAGTIFMDYRNSKDFSDVNTILYGHHMKNGSMFASLKRFAEKDFFASNQKGTIFLADRTLAIEFFAYLIVKTDDNVIYAIPDSSELTIYMDYIKNNAKNYREIGVGPEDRIVTLSTCSYEFNSARMVLLGKLIQEH